MRSRSPPPWGSVGHGDPGRRAVRDAVADAQGAGPREGRHEQSNPGHAGQLQGLQPTFNPNQSSSQALVALVPATKDGGHSNFTGLNVAALRSRIPRTTVELAMRRRGSLPEGYARPTPIIEGGTTTWVDMKNKVAPWVEPASV